MIEKKYIVSFIIAVLLFVIIYKVLKGLNLIKSGKEEKEEKAKETAKENPLGYEPTNPNYYKEVQKRGAVVGKPKASLKAIATKIYDSMAGMGTDEDKFFSTLPYIKNRVQLSMVADEYRNLFSGRSMIIDITQDLGSNDMDKFLNWVNGLPVGYAK